MAGDVLPATGSPLPFINRLALLLACLPALAGCAGSAESLGLTGAPLTAPPAEASDATIGLPGVNPGTGPYTPSLLPSTGAGRYFGYGD